MVPLIPVGPVKVEPPPLQPPSLELLASHADWRTGWTHIVAGRFSPSLYSGLLFYEQSTGTADFYETDGAGGMSLLRHDDGWRTSWTHVVPGFFGGTGNTGLLLYDQAAGFGAFYDTDGAGNLVPLSEFDNWRTTWTLIVPGRFSAPQSGGEYFPSPYTGVLFYEQSTGTAEIYSTDGRGGISMLSSYDNWRTSWTHIVAGEFLNSEGFENSARQPETIDDLFLYEGSTGYAETYQSDGNGGLGDGVGGYGPAASAYGFPAATQIAAGSFGGSGNANLVFLDRDSGLMSLQNLGTKQNLGTIWWELEQFTWQQPWDLLVAGNFYMADPQDDRFFPDGSFTDLVLYDRVAGQGEFYLHEPPDPTPIAPFAGYAVPRSAAPGQTVAFHVSSQVGPYSITVYRQETDPVEVGSVSVLPSAPAPYPISRTAYKTGANWPADGLFAIPGSWPSGLYFGRVTMPPLIFEPPGAAYGYPDGAPRSALPTARVGRLQPNAPVLDIPFVVRRGPKQSQARILYAISDNTYNAYNYWGGRSLYGYGSAGQLTWVGPSSSQFHAPHACRVSFERPHTPLGPDLLLQWQTWEVPLLSWSHRQGIAIDVCTESDLHSTPELLDRYQLLVIAGHSEYWSGLMRDQVEGFVHNGGNLVIFSGNTCWWQVRFEDDANTMVCYKQTFDPAYGSAATRSETTVNWVESFLQRPQARMTGLGWNTASGLTATSQYLVDQPAHWVFANTGLGSGDGFGLYQTAQGVASVLGAETDHQDTDTPDNFLRVAHEEEDGVEITTMGLFAPNASVDGFTGIVFNVGTMNWTRGLSQDGGWSAIDQITRNLLIRLG